MYTLHIANKNYSSWSLRPWLLMKELGIPFTEKLSPFTAGGVDQNFTNFSPTGLVPCLIDGEQSVWDSLAITEYLAEKHNGIWPEDTAARTWARCATAEMHSGFSTLREMCAMSCGIRATLKTIPKSLQKDIDRIDQLWNQGLEQFNGPYLGGKNFSAVDAFYAPVAFRIRSFNLALSEKALAYANLLLSSDAIQEWEQAAVKESWREPGHEADITKYADIVEDFRV